jgi:hypothetical protein
MSEEPSWPSLLATVREPRPVTAWRHLRGPIACSFSRPHAYSGKDKKEYVVKFRRADQLRTVASEQVVGRAGKAIKAAVGDVVAFRVPADLLPPGEDVSAAGVSHACRLIPNLVDGGVAHVDENRQRLGSLAILYTWTRAANHQLVYEQRSSPVVYSVDHGHFLPPDTQWTATSLDAEPDPSAIDPWFTSQGVALGDCTDAARRLDGLTPKVMAQIAKSARVEWAVTDEERLALCRFLWRRRQATLALLGGVFDA